MKKNNFCFLVLLSLIFTLYPVVAYSQLSSALPGKIPSKQEPDQALLEELKWLQAELNVEVYSASKTKKKISEAPSIITVITAKEIEKMGARTLSDILKIMPGIQILNRRNGSDMVWIRGVTTGYNSKVLLLVDGVPYREVVYSQWSPDENIALNNVERIEIIRGPGSALYGGNAYAGVISIFTKNTVDKTSASVALGSFDTKRYQFYTGNALGEAKLIFSGNLSETDGHKMERDRKGYETNHSDRVEAANFQTKLLYKDFVFSLNRNDLTTEYPLHATGSDKAQHYKITHGFTDYVFKNDKLVVNPKLYFFHTTQFFKDVRTNDTGQIIYVADRHLESLVWGFDGQVTYNLLENNTVVAGISAEQPKAKEMYEDRQRDGSSVAVKDTWLEQDGNTSPKTFNYAVYVQDEMQFMDKKINLTLGSRFDKYEEFDAELSPRIGLVLNPVKKLTIKTLWGKAFRPPTYRQKYEINLDGRSSGNPNLEPEKISTFETEIGYAIAKNITSKVTYFKNNLSNFIESVSYAPYSNNANEKEISGVEVELRGEFKPDLAYLKTVSLFANYSYLDGKDIKNSQENDIPSIAKHYANMGVCLRNNKITLYSGLNFMGERNASDSYHSRVEVAEYENRNNKDSYIIWDINLGLHDFSRWPLRVDFTVRNVLDVKHFNPIYSPDSYYDYTKESRYISLKLTCEL
ncbi:TonB-dependent receptor plug domain-containing protein [Candidatus Auribacterota bacterium]